MCTDTESILILVVMRTVFPLLVRILSVKRHEIFQFYAHITGLCTHEHQPRYRRTGQKKALFLQYFLNERAPKDRKHM